MGQNFWELLAGIGIFLFGMHLLEESIRLLSGAALRKFIKNYTNNLLKAIGTGIIATAILQSSSAVTLIVLAFAGAAIMPMNSAIGVILGANIGTTFTSWIVALLGFKMSIEAIALPIIGIGGLFLIFLGKSEKYTQFSKLLVGFGFIFMGLDYMKKAVEEGAAQFDLTVIQDAHILLFVLTGFILTAVVQSSSAAMAIILSGISSGIINFEFGAAMVIGSNLGTTVTVIIGSIGGNIIKKRIAWSHFLFNSTSALLAIILLPLFGYLINDVFNLSHDPVTGLALFHTLFNIAGVLIFTPFLDFFVRLIIKIVPERKKQILHFLPLTSPVVPEAAILALQNEVFRLMRLSMFYNIRIIGSSAPVYHQLKTGIHYNHSNEMLYLEMKEIQDAIFSYSAEMQHQNIPVEITEQLNSILHAARYALISSKSLKDIKLHIDEIIASDQKYSKIFFAKQLKDFESVYSKLLQLDHPEIPSALVDELYQLNIDFKTYDSSFSLDLMKLLMNNEIEQKEISELLSLQRGFTQSLRQIIAAHRNILLSKKQADILDKMTS